ncbi:hypothetical protein N7520_004028 [Penicillium odoratum]|uniref:uncharacterized protein n=1 Tax=Penicillium odoratum TaxID=1167516 RepID=UPI002546D402|nr:uncharacterized protein N7520_004028 [Penicillium odoratum]KAJ5769469.1 hypothetical protein N7520_004028 [Penicillium odoratum]
MFVSLVPVHSFIAEANSGIISALVRASRNEDTCKIADKTVGILLLGTPHYSDDSLLKEAKKYFQLVNVNIPTDSELQARSTRVLEIPRAFEAFRKDRSIRVDTFYEDQPISINGENVYIVEKSVAKLWGDPKFPKALNGDHHEMARFDSENEDFEDILRSIRQITDKISEQQKAQGGTNISFSGHNLGLQVGQNNGNMNGYSFFDKKLQ